MNTRYIDNVKHLELLTFTGEYNMPVIKREDIELNTNTVSFNNRTQKECVAIHFFIDDYQFDRIWNNPERYIEMFKKYRHQRAGFSKYKSSGIIALQKGYDIIKVVGGNRGDGTTEYTGDYYIVLNRAAVIIKE